MLTDDDDITADKLSNGLWAWIYQPGNGVYMQSPEQFKTKASAVKAGQKWLTVNFPA